jgi:hypothetical protein
MKKKGRSEIRNISIYELKKVGAESDLFYCKRCLIQTGRYKKKAATKDW